MKHGLWAFEARIVEDGKPMRKGRYKGQFLGSAKEATEEAGKLQAQMRAGTPEASLTVVPIPLEGIGPGTMRHIEGLVAQMQQEHLLARFMAAQLAPFVAEKSLELAPNLEAIANELLQQSRMELEGNYLLNSLGGMK